MRSYAKPHTFAVRQNIFIILTAIAEYGRTDGFLRCTLGRGFGEYK